MCSMCQLSCLVTTEGDQQQIFPLLAKAIDAASHQTPYSQQGACYAHLFQFSN